MYHVLTVRHFAVNRKVIILIVKQIKVLNFLEKCVNIKKQSLGLRKFF